MKLAPSLWCVVFVLSCATASTDDVGSEPSEEQIAAEIEFARGLMSRFRDPDLAQEVLAGLDPEAMPAALCEKNEVVWCELVALQARAESTSELRLALYEEAYARHIQFLTAHPFSEFFADVYEALPALCLSLARELDPGRTGVTGEAAEVRRDRMREVLDRGLAFFDPLSDPHPGPSRREKAIMARWQRQLTLGSLFIARARLSDDGTLWWRRADSILEDFVFEAGERSSWGLEAYLLLAESKLAQGDDYEAAACAEFVAEATAPPRSGPNPAEEWENLLPRDRNRRWAFLERSLDPLFTACRNLEDHETTIRWALRYHDAAEIHHRGDSSPRGSLLLLEVARVLLESHGFVGGSQGGGELRWFETKDEMHDAGFTVPHDSRRAEDLALSLAVRMAHENRRNLVGVRARKLIGEIRDQPNPVLAPEILFEAALGEYYHGDHHRAAASLRGVMAALDTGDEAARRTLQPRVLGILGLCYQKMNRPLEAAMVHREAVMRWTGDVEFDPVNLRAYSTALGEVRRATGKTGPIEDLWQDARRRVLEMEGERSPR